MVLEFRVSSWVYRRYYLHVMVTNCSAPSTYDSYYEVRTSPVIHRIEKIVAKYRSLLLHCPWCIFALGEGRFQFTTEPNCSIFRLSKISSIIIPIDRCRRLLLRSLTWLFLFTSLLSLDIHTLARGFSLPATEYRASPRVGNRVIHSKFSPNNACCYIRFVVISAHFYSHHEWWY